MELQLGYSYIVNIDLDKLHPGYPGIANGPLATAEYMQLARSCSFQDAASLTVSCTLRYRHSQKVFAC